MAEPDYSKMTKGQMRVLLTDNNVLPPPGDLKKAELVEYCKENIRAGGPRTPGAALIPSPYRGHTEERHVTSDTRRTGERHGRKVREMSPDSARKNASPAFHPGAGAGGAGNRSPKKKTFGANVIRGVNGEVVPPPPKRTLGAPKANVASPKKNVVFVNDQHNDEDVVPVPEDTTPAGKAFFGMLIWGILVCGVLGGLFAFRQEIKASINFDPAEVLESVQGGLATTLDKVGLKGVVDKMNVNDIKIHVAYSAAVAQLHAANARENVVTYATHAGSWVQENTKVLVEEGKEKYGAVKESMQNLIEVLVPPPFCGPGIDDGVKCRACPENGSCANGELRCNIRYKEADGACVPDVEGNKMAVHMGHFVVKHLAERKGEKLCGCDLPHCKSTMTKKEIETFLKESGTFSLDKFWSGYAHLFSDDLEEFRYNIGIRETNGKYSAEHALKPMACRVKEFAVDYAMMLMKWIAIILTILAVISTPFLIMWYYYLRRRKITALKVLIEENTIFEPLSGPTFAEIEDLWADEGRGTMELDGLCEELLKKDGTVQKSVDPYRGGSAFFFSLNSEGSQRRQSMVNSPGAHTPAHSVYHSPQAPLTTPGAKTYGSGIDYFRTPH